jgi:preprotein translocase subunit SecF
MEFFHGTKIDFLSKRALFFFASLAINLLGIVFVFVAKPEFGIDFVGGTEMAVRIQGAANQTDKVRLAMDNAKYTNTQIKSYGQPEEYLIRVPNSAALNLTQSLTQALQTQFPQNTITILKTNTIGPKVGAELRQDAVLAVGLAIIAILAYVAFRFDFLFGLGAVVALIHDVILAVVLSVAFNKLHIIHLEINQDIIAAILTVLGFSIHDKVIIFDRIRENREKHKNITLIELLNLSINETLSRTVNTVLTAALVLLVIVGFGGEVLQGFAFVMLVGFVTGVYSSVYVAGSFVVWYLENIRKVDVAHVAHTVALKARA